jgi:phenylpyruvate tautomerase PptA (4-oxalocrotonate tautomerase family)
VPYLRVTCPESFEPAFPKIAEALTEAVNDLFFNPRAPVTREELRERTTIHFDPYRDGRLYVGARTPAQRGFLDITVQLADWSMSVKQQRRVAAALTPVLARLFEIDDAHREHVNIKFEPYPPTDFSVGGTLLSDLLPRAARWAKKAFG